MTFLRPAMALAAALVAFPVAARAQYVDQSNYLLDSRFSNANRWTGESFTPTMNTSVGAGFGIETLDAAASGVMTIELWSDVASHSGAQLLRSAHASYALTLNQIVMVDMFWEAVSLTPGHTYFLAMNVQTSDLRTYTRGTGDVGRTLQETAYYNFSETDTDSYNTGVSNQVLYEEFSATAAPEPSSVILLGTGLFGVAGAVRRRRGRDR